MKVLHSAIKALNSENISDYKKTKLVNLFFIYHCNNNRSSNSNIPKYYIICTNYIYTSLCIYLIYICLCTPVYIKVQDTYYTIASIRTNDLNPSQAKELFQRLLVTSALKFDGAPKVFVLNFKGNLSASTISNLREEVTAVLLAAKHTRGDRVVCRINSPGGTVTGYGFGAAQLERITVLFYVDKLIHYCFTLLI